MLGNEWKKKRLRSDLNQQLIFCDFHIHSKYSRATSKKMDLNSIAHFAQIKGLNLVGTGDFTHPRWSRDIKNYLSEIPDVGLYHLKDAPHIQTCFMITGEVNTIFYSDNKCKKIHHLILTPNLDLAEQINDKIRNHNNLSADGRPILNLTASSLVEAVMEVSKDNVVIPAHIWTPWYSLFGSINGFDRIKDCYEDMTKHIFALETGLSSDPPMNWRLSSLDKFTLVSNSDAHSPYPYRIGREANVIEVEKLSYSEVVKAIRRRDLKRFKFTIETNPAYGKYHWTGHRNCMVSMPPSESKKLSGICPVCRKPMTRGVDERIEDLADRPPRFKPKDSVKYMHLLPLQEAIGAAIGVKNPLSPYIWRRYNSLIASFGNEYSVLLFTPLKALEKVVEPRIAETILKIRNGDITVIPGYDGMYGEIKLFDQDDKVRNNVKYRKQNSLERFFDTNNTIVL